MDDEEEQGHERLVPGSVQLTVRQWAWLRGRSREDYSRSISAQVRQIVAEAMVHEREREAVPA